MNIRRIIGVTALSLAAIATTAGTGHADVRAQAGGCEFRLTNVLALDLQEAGGDEIFMGIGDERTRTVSFTEGQTHEGSDFGNADQVTEFIPPGGSIAVSVFEHDTFSNQLIGSFRVPCRAIATQRDVSGAGAFYRVSYVVTQLP